MTLVQQSPWKGRIFNGSWEPAKGGTLDVTEPATGEILTQVGQGGAADVEEAARSAAAAQVA